MALRDSNKIRGLGTALTTTLGVLLLIHLISTSISPTLLYGHLSPAAPFTLLASLMMIQIIALVLWVMYWIETITFRKTYFATKSSTTI